MGRLVLMSCLAGVDRHANAPSPAPRNGGGAEAAPPDRARGTATAALASPLSALDSASPHPPPGGAAAGCPAGYRRTLAGRLCPRRYPPLLTIAKAPGTPPLVSEAMRQALRERLAPPQGVGSDKAIWPWLHQEVGVPLAYTTVQKRVRSTLRATRQGPRNSPISTS
jgi:hypothetical protein